MIPEQISRTIRDVGHFILVTHIRPDGDALGSLFGLADILKSLDKNVFCYLQDPLPAMWDFLPDRQQVSLEFSELEQFVTKAGGDIAIISLDCGSADRLGRHKDGLLAVKPFMVIDHHIAHQPYGDILWLEPNRSSTGEMVYELAMEIGAEISYACAFDLYVAICTDTGSFRYDSTTPATMRIAADLLERGVKPEEVACRVYDNYSLQRLKLMEKVLATLQLHESQQLAVIYVTREMFEETGASENDAEGFINYPRSLRSVRVAVLLKEGKDGVVFVSMRAKGTCDVARVAGIFGGGGHRNAAGCRFFGSSIDLACKELLPVLRDALDAPVSL